MNDKTKETKETNKPAPVEKQKNLECDICHAQFGGAGSAVDAALEEHKKTIHVEPPSPAEYQALKEKYEALLAERKHH